MKLLLTVSPAEDREIREAAKAEGRTISDFLRARVFGGEASVGGVVEEKIKEIADLQRVNISILARMWGEQNQNAAQIIRDMMDIERRK